MRILLCLGIALTASFAHAQRAGESLWLNIDYTYSEFTYKEPTATIKGHLPGVRGDLGLGLFDYFGVSAGGEYRDGNLTYEGATYTKANTKAVTGDYMRDTFALAHMMFGPITISGGVGQREWLNNINGNYRRRMFTDYYPASVMFYRSGFYLKGETYLVKSGHAKIYMHDTGTGALDVDLKQNSGNGYGAEIGFMLPNMLRIQNRIFLAYKRWDIGASEAKSDGEQNIQVDKYTMEVYEAGLGLSF